MVYILDPSDTGVPLVRCLLVGAHLIHVTGRDTWVVTCPLGGTSYLLATTGVPAARR